MIGTITYILARAGWRAMNGTIADERRRLAGAEPPAAYVSYDPRLLAGVGWYGYRIAFKGGDRQMIERALYMLSERYTIRDSYENYADGVYVIGVLLRQRLPHYGIGGGTPTPEPDALNFYMPNGGMISLNKIGSPTVVQLEYSLDKGKTWTLWQVDNNGNRSLVLTAGQRMYVRNTSETQTGFSTSNNDYYQFGFTNTAEAQGNTNSLLCKNADSVTTLTSYCYRSLFRNCTSLVLAPELPGTTLTAWCYEYMFDGCTGLTQAPELPSTTLAYRCYAYMFSGCTGLTQAPALPATTLTPWCYAYMFSGCTGLTQAPALPVTTLAERCYYFMFDGCTGLTQAPELPATTLVSGCYAYMFSGCTSLTQAPALPVTTLADRCYAYMFSGCTGLTQAPALPATTLVSGCYAYMFSGCTSLTQAPELPATTLVDLCYYEMFSGCSQLQEVRTMMINISASNCLTNWLYGVSPTGDFYCTAELTIPTGVSGIPSGWTRHDI